MTPLAAAAVRSRNPATGDVVFTAPATDPRRYVYSSLTALQARYQATPSPAR